MNNSKAVWFSRHAPTAGQLADLNQGGVTLVGVEEGMRLGSANLADADDVQSVVLGLFDLAKKHGASAVYGVFAAPVQSEVYVSDRCNQDAKQKLFCYASWNVSRSVDGGKPTFEHKEFVLVGVLRA